MRKPTLLLQFPNQHASCREPVLTKYPLFHRRSLATIRRRGRLPISMRAKPTVACHGACLTLPYACHEPVLVVKPLIS